MTDQPNPPLARCVCGSIFHSFNYDIGRMRSVCTNIDCLAATPWYHTRAEAIAAWNRMQDVDEWQPIETAPTDGTAVLLWTGHYQHTGIVFDDGSRTWFALADDVELVPRPTHWRPLPAPPGGGDNG